VSWKIENPQDAQDAYIDPVKIWLVLDTQTNGAAASGTDVFVLPTTGLSIATGNLALNNLQNSQRFRILASETLQPPTNALVTGFGSSTTRSYLMAPFSLSKEWKTPLRVTFKDGGAGGTVANITDNSLHIFVCSAVEAAPVVHSITYSSRLRYFSQ